MKPKVGDVSPSEYDWRKAFDPLRTSDGYVLLDAGKVRGIAVALHRAEETNKRLLSILKEAKGAIEYDPTLRWSVKLHGKIADELNK